MSLTLIGGRVSAQGKVRAQFASILDSMKSFQEKSEMCTLLSPGAIAHAAAAGLVATKPLPSLTNSSSGAVACAEELVKNIKRDDSGAQVAAMGGKLKTGSLPTAWSDWNLLKSADLLDIYLKSDDNQLEIKKSAQLDNVGRGEVGKFKITEAARAHS